MTSFASVDLNQNDFEGHLQVFVASVQNITFFSLSSNMVPVLLRRQNMESVHLLCFSKAFEDFYL